MEPRSSNIILLNKQDEVLLHLRDNKPTLLYPNRWVLPGGYIEEGETPEKCILREIKEEMNIDLKKVWLYMAVRRSYGFEYTFYTYADFSSKDVILTEGQAISWFSFDRVRQMKLGYEDNTILEGFLRKKPVFGSVGSVDNQFL